MVSAGVLIAAALISALLGATGTIAATAINAHSQDKANETNKEINKTNNTFNAEQAEITRDFNAEQAEVDRSFNAEQAEANRAFQAEQAQIQRDYETYMSNTAIQRKAADLAAAGFNPSLAIGSGGASTPGVTAATGSAATGSRASSSPIASSGFIPMKAADFSPLAQISNNLNHLVNSATQIAKLQSIIHHNPGVGSAMNKIGQATTNTVTSAAKMEGLDSVLKKYGGYDNIKKIMGANLFID